MPTMAIAHVTKVVLVGAFLVAIPALFIAARVPRLSGREMVAPEAWSALEGRDAERAASLFREALKERPVDPVLHFGAGSAAFALGRTSQALASLRRAVELDPQFPEALAALGQVAYARGDTRLAIQSMEKASALRPRDGDSRDARSLAPRIVGAQRVCRTDGRALPDPVPGRHETKCR